MRPSTFSRCVAAAASTFLASSVAHAQTAAGYQPVTVPAQAARTTVLDAGFLAFRAARLARHCARRCAEGVAEALSR